MLNLIHSNPLSLVPQEIRAQGLKAEAAFKEAMEKGSVPVYRGRIMLLGQDRAGKTSLKNFLLGIPFDPEEDSTVGVEVEIDQVKEWQRTDKKKLDLSAIEDIAKITAENVKALEGKSQETIDPFKIEVFTYYNDFIIYKLYLAYLLLCKLAIKIPKGTYLSVNLGL